MMEEERVAGIRWARRKKKSHKVLHRQLVSVGGYGPPSKFRARRINTKRVEGRLIPFAFITRANDLSN